MAKTESKTYGAEFMSLYDLLTSINQHLSNIEGSVTQIREAAEDTNVRVRQREKVPKSYGKVSKAPR